jgi:hypothetical protein
MIPNTKLRVVQSQGVEVTGEFGISLADSAHIMTILRDTLYSDKVLAVLREYSSNAWDAHRDSGKPDMPIEIHLPTPSDPTLNIRDFGPGLSPENVFEVFTQYGASTKRDNDNSVGMLGIGCKSGFAYSDSFTVVSCHGGVKRTYVAVLDNTDKGVMNQLHEEECGDETGVLIKIAVNPDDIEEFRLKAQDLFRYFVPRPKINCHLEDLPRAEKVLKAGVIYGRSDEEWVAVMGCVPYRIDLKQLPDLGRYIHDISGALYFQIGEVSINASREGLKYNDSTKKMLVDRFNELIDEFVQVSLMHLKNLNCSPWQRRIEGQALGRLGVPIPKDDDTLIASSVAFPKDPPKSFTVGDVEQEGIYSLTVNDSSRILLRDDKRQFRGFQIQARDYIVRANPDFTWDQVLVDLNEMLEEMQATGIPILKMSEMPWIKPLPKNGKIKNVKHSKRVFVFKPQPHGYYGDPYSSHWETKDHVPTKKDVFVVISEFKAVGFNFFQKFEQDIELAEYFKAEMPKHIFAYKTTASRPVDPAKVEGTDYLTWSRQFTKDLLSKKRVQKVINHRIWSTVTSNNGSDMTNTQVRDALDTKLGKYHPISIFFKRHLASLVWYRKKQSGDRTLNEVVDALIRRLGEQPEKSEAEKALVEIGTRYPLLGLREDALRVLWSSHSDKWLEYIQLVDRSLAEKEKP